MISHTSRLGAYVILDARLSQELEKDLVASLRLDNLGGARYQEYLGPAGSALHGQHRPGQAVLRRQV